MFGRTHALMFRRTHAFGLAAAVVLTGGVIAQVPPASASTAEIGYQASAYGTHVTVGPLVKSGLSALASLGCVSHTGVSHTNTAASVNALPALTTGTVDTSAASRGTATGVAATGSSTVQSASVLSGLVSATAVKSVSTASRNSSTGAFGVSAAGTSFVDLKVNGKPVSGTPAPNTKITLPGVGYVLLNQQFSHVTKHSAELTVIAVHVVVTTTTSVGKAGTQVVVADASSHLGGPVTGLFSGLAYGANAHVGTTVIAGELFPQPLACLGTGGKTKTNSAASASIPAVLTAGAVTDTVEGRSTATTVSGKVTAAVQNLNLLAGKVTATAVEADVSATGNPPVTADHSSFVGLSVAGHPGLGDNPAPNTKLSLAGIGTLWLHRVFRTAGGIKVIMIQLVVTVPNNPSGLKPGTEVDVAYARIGIH
jgi:hypothetical protein